MKIKKKKLSPEEKVARKAKRAEKRARRPVKSRVQKTIEKHRINVARYIKVSNRFERQKLSRRQTEQKKDPEKVAKILAEITASNALDPDVLADRHMRKTFSKIRSVYESPELPEQWRATTKETVLEPALANVSARLFSHKLVKMAMNKCINNVRMAIAHQEVEQANATGGEAEVKMAKAKVVLKKLEDDMRSTPELPDAPLKLVKAKSRISSTARQTKDEELSDDEVLKIYDGEEEAPAAEASQAGMDVDAQVQPQQTRKRKASESADAKEAFSASDSASSESDATASVADSDTNSGFVPVSDSDSDSDSASDSDLDSETDSEAPARKKAKTKRSSHTTSAAAAAVQSSNSVFVPSLTAVGYVDNSDSEASDLDEEVAPRKNRRGQKARQAIWEKKYKDKAKHLQKQEQSQQSNGKQRGKHKEGKSDDKNDGWDPRRGAVSSTTTNGHTDGSSRAKHQRRMDGDGNKREREKEQEHKPLHPSWAAKKQLKAKEQLIDQYAGKKITF